VNLLISTNCRYNSKSNRFAQTIYFQD